MRELFLFVRPPRAAWPFNGPSTAFWPPLAFASLAAALRESVRDIDVQILDCPALRMGWKSLAGELARRVPCYVGIGEEAVSAAEGLRLASMAKELGASIIAGGCTFGNLAAEVLSTGSVDVVVRGEGERTLAETVEALRNGGAEALSAVRGVAFRRGDETVITPPRLLIADLDDLPMPAYDLLPVERYGRGSRNHPDFASIEHSRGCTGSCGFCVLWRQMAVEGQDGPQACYRTKSPERAMEEVRVLTRRFGRRYLCWVDPCFNADAVFLDGFAQRMERERLVIGQSAWVRSDYLMRDEQSGLLAKLVARGLNEIFMGIECVDKEGLCALGRSNGRAAGLEILPEIARKYPSLYTVGSFIYGLPGDSWRTVMAMRNATIDLNLDTAFYIPLTGLPGTAFWNREDWDGEAKGLHGMNFLTAGGQEADRVRGLTRLLSLSFLLDFRPRRIGYLLRTLLAPDARKRRMNRRLLVRGASFAVRQLASPKRYGNGAAMPLPKWYNR